MLYLAVSPREAQDAARTLLQADPDLTAPDHQAMGAIINEIFDQNKDGWN